MAAVMRANSPHDDPSDSSDRRNRSLIVGVTGASGLIYAVRTLRYALAAGATVDLVASKGAQMVWQAEQRQRMPVSPLEQATFWRQQAGVPEAGTLRCHPWGDVGATIASGSFRTLGMVVIPCSMSTVGKLAAGLSSDLLERAADVQLKEGRSLVLVPRETPFSLIHLRNLTTLAEAGARIVPAIPAWYHQPQTIEDLVDFVVARALDQLDLDYVSSFQRWQGHLSPGAKAPEAKAQGVNPAAIKAPGAKHGESKANPPASNGQSPGPQIPDPSPGSP